MKKTLLFLSVFFFFGFLTAEEVQVGKYKFEDVTITLFEDREPEPEPEPAKEAEKEPEPEPESPLENKVKEPKPFYIQPMVVVGISYGGEDDRLYEVVDTNADLAFHLAETSRGDNIYLGFNLGVRYSGSLFRTVEIPVQSKLAFDFKRNSPYGTPEYVSFWLALGLSAGLYDSAYVFPFDPSEEVSPEWDMIFSWGIGTDLSFENGFILQFAIKSFIYLYPVPSFGLGCRF